MTTADHAKDAFKQATGGLVVPPGGSSKSSFGLGAVSGMPVNTGGLFPVDSPNPTAEQVMEAFAKLRDPSQIAIIQDQLKRGGFYSSDSYNPHYGVLNAEDIDAFKKATTTSAQTGSDLSAYLTSQAKVGDYQGVAAAIQSNNQHPTEIKQANPLDLGVLITKEYQALTGKKPTDAEKAGFISAYNTMFAQMQKDRIAALSGQALTPEQQKISDFYNDPLAQAAAAATPQPVTQTPGFDDLSPLGHPRPTEQFPLQPSTAPHPTALLRGGGQVQITEMFDPSSFAEQYVQQHAGAQSDAHSMTGQFSSFLKILGGIG